MANVNFGSFTSITDAANIAGSDYLVGYKNTSAGGERRTTIDALSSNLTTGTLYPDDLYTNNIYNKSTPYGDLFVKPSDNLLVYSKEYSGFIQKNTTVGVYTTRVNTSIEKTLYTTDPSVTINLLDMAPTYWGNNMYRPEFGNALNVRVVVNIQRTNIKTGVVTPYNGAYQGYVSFDTYKNSQGYVGWTVNDTNITRINVAMGRGMDGGLVQNNGAASPNTLYYGFASITATRETATVDGTVNLVILNCKATTGYSTTTYVAVYFDLLTA
jgi:hypothetical protein